MPIFAFSAKAAMGDSIRGGAADDAAAHRAGDESMVVIYAERTQTVLDITVLVGYGVVVGLRTAVCVTLAAPVARVLGRTGSNGSSAGL